jgi:histone acetyltransferase
MGFVIFFYFRKNIYLKKKMKLGKNCDKNKKFFFAKKFEKKDFPIKDWLDFLKKIKTKKFFIRRLVNDGSYRSFLKIISLRKVFTNQLPNMPIDYVNKLMFDKKHNLVSIERVNNSKIKIIGGCCYRYFKKKEIIELVFLAISTSEQGKGLGKELMLRIREIARKLGAKSVIACADNNAITYFKKQGFSKRISIPYSLWIGYIKDYEEISVMETIIDDDKEIISKSFLQLNILKSMDKNIKNLNQLDKILNNFRIISDKKKNCLFSKLKIVEKNLNTTVRICEYQNIFSFEKTITKILDKLKISPITKPFSEPVDIKLTGAIDYFKITPHPMDIRTIEEKFRSKIFYLNPKVFKDNFFLMIKNCQWYNGNFHSISFYSSEVEKIHIALSKIV